jgi:hypothetical protein
MNPGHRRPSQRGQAMVLLVLSMAVVLVAQPSSSMAATA